MRSWLTIVALLLEIGTQFLRADEPTRRAQEELRKRNLYFGDIDGKSSPELAQALQRYQARKGFSATGELDQETAGSLKIQTAASQNNSSATLPDVPVLKSDIARQLAEPDEAKLEPTDADAMPASSPPPPAEFLNKEETERVQRITKFVGDYLHDAEGDDVDLQVNYYAFPVQYFDHGRAGRDFVVKDTRNYVKRWPQRKYTMLGPVKFLSLGKAGELEVEFTIGFSVANGNHVAHGKTRNLWTIRPDREIFKILAINEQRLHD